MLVTVASTAVAAVDATVGPVPEAGAASCYPWRRTLRQGAAGGDVRQLQIRLSGHPPYGGQVAIDGVFGPGTRNALIRFQRARRLQADGIAGPATFRVIESLQDSDCTPIHFSYREFDRSCGGSNWRGGRVSPGVAKVNAIVTMWKLEAMRHAMGSRPVTVASGFRSVSCNRRIGGSRNSRHLYGDAADLVSGPYSLCTLARRARHHGFTGIYGPGFPGHSSHVHLDGKSTRSWRAPRCGV